MWAGEPGPLRARYWQLAARYSLVNDYDSMELLMCRCLDDVRCAVCAPFDPGNNLEAYARRGE